MVPSLLVVQNIPCAHSKLKKPKPDRPSLIDGGELLLLEASFQPQLRRLDILYSHTPIPTTLVGPSRRSRSALIIDDESKLRAPMQPTIERGSLTPAVFQQ